MEFPVPRDSSLPFIHVKISHALFQLQGSAKDKVKGREKTNQSPYDQHDAYREARSKNQKVDCNAYDLLILSN